MKYVLIILLTIIGIETHAQESSTIYYDSDWKVIPNKKDASYYRKIEPDPNKKVHFNVKDFYITGEIQMEAGMISIEPEVMDGEVNYFFKNGRQHTSQKYINGKENGNYKEWYENGKIEKEGLVKNDEFEGEWLYYYTNGNMRMVGTYIAGNKNGIWKISNIEGKYYLNQTYEKNVLVDIKLVDESDVLYEYITKIDSTGKSNMIPFIEISKKEEFKLTEKLIRKNIDFLKTCTNFNTFQVVYQYTIIWLTNCPYLGKIQIITTPFMINYTTEIEKSYKYQPLMTKMYFLGLCNYVLENNGEIKDINKYHESGANYMIDYYLVLKKIDTAEESKKMENLVDKQKSGKLLDYIRKY